jgi:pimeloyl-ACP methyl ester carboxylesterase
LWMESLWPVEWLALRVAPVYFGIGIPHGDGSAVVLVPGFMGNDLYLGELHRWLRRIGYRSYLPRVGINVGCPNRVAEALAETVERARKDTGRRVRLIGHSLGGVIGRRTCLQHPGLVSQLIYLGSPVRQMSAHPALVGAVALAQIGAHLLSPGKPADCLTNRCAGSCRLPYSGPRYSPVAMEWWAGGTLRRSIPR